MENVFSPEDMTCNQRFLVLFSDFLASIVNCKCRDSNDDEDFRWIIIDSRLNGLESFTINFRCNSLCVSDLDSIVNRFAVLKDSKIYRPLPSLRSSVTAEYDDKCGYVVYSLRVWLDLPF